MNFKLLFLTTFIFTSVFAQKTTVRGIVASSENMLYGVSVTEKNTGNSTTTDFDGSFQIKVSTNATLVFSYIGFTTQEVLITGDESLNIILKETVNELDELVIYGFEGVVGQARRRAESIQDIPESVVTYTSETIETKGVENLKTFTDYVPNVNFTSSLGIGNNFITVRGISHIRNGESPIAFVVDGVTLPDANLINQELFDIALIEVVKGPQGALYGKNAIAGAVNILTNKPTNNFKHKVLLGYGSGTTFKRQFVTSGPLAKNKVFYRLSASSKKGDGVIDNEFLNTPVDFIDETTVRAQIRTIFSDRTKLTVTGQYLDSEGGGSYFASPIVDETPETPLVDNAAPDNFDNYAITSDQLGGSSLEGLYGNARLQFSLDDVKIVSSTTYNKSDRNNFGDFDFTNVDILRQNQDSNSETFSQEVRVSSVANDSKISWDLGVFYQNSDKLFFTEVFLNAGLIEAPFIPIDERVRLGVGDFTNTFKTLAAFGFLDYKLSDKLTVSFGLRFDNDDISQENIALPEEQERTDSELQPKFSLAYKALDNVLLYANYGRGYRNGGFNQDRVGGIELTYEPELTDNFEFGIKNSFWKDRVILNASAYYIDFTNQQQFRLLVGGGTGDGSIRNGIINFEESESYGFEVDLRVRPSKYFDILAGYGLSTSRITRGTARFSTADNTEFDVAGNRTPLIPENSFALGLESKIDFSKKTQFNANVLLKGTGDIYWHEDNAAVSSAYSLLSGRVGFKFNKSLSLFVWGDNILGEDYITEFFGEPFSNGGKDVVWVGNPATFGASLGYDF